MSADPTGVVGTVVAERYEIVRVLGRGSNGAVCEVVDRSTGLPAALKMLVGEDADLAGRLEREGTALGMLAHPHIVALVDTGRDESGRPYIATELIRGISLRDVLDAGAVEPRRALAIVCQLLEALDHLHGVGMIHRDIKPENIMLADGGQPGRDYVKLLDFGVAKVIDPTSEVLGAEQLTRAGLEVLGSPPYIAPETAIGERIDARTDLYSVGIVMFEMLAGRVPFQHDDAATLLRKHVTDPVPRLRTVVPELEAIVHKALAKVAGQRFESAIAMHAAVEAAARKLESEADDASSSSLAARARRAARSLGAATRQHPGKVAAIATAAVVVVLVLVILIRSSPDAIEATSPVAATSSSRGEPPATKAASEWITTAESEVARRRYSRAIAAYERALASDRALVRDVKLRAAVVQIAGGGDPVAAVIALEMLATRLDPVDHKTIVEQASTGKLLDVRRRAFAIAERDGFAQSIDRLASWTLDLKQGATCEDRREIIVKLRDLGDPRVVAVLQRARAQYACVAKDADAAITQLQSTAGSSSP